MTLYEFLAGQREDLPTWLDTFQAGTPFSREVFFGSRVVYYPGSGTDGHPVKVFGSTHSAHCFVYADYMVSQARLEETLDSVHRFRGYHTVSRLQLREADLVPSGWTRHLEFGDPQDRYGFSNAIAAAPFGFLEVLERDSAYDESHGARRLAILFLGADGIATYDALFCQRTTPTSPYAVLLQDHGFGGNYEHFGRHGLLETIAQRTSVFPRWLLTARHGTQAWEGYSPVPDVEGDRGGQHNDLRFLSERRTE